MIRPVWRAERQGVALVGVGDVGLLQGPLAAFFASRQCPGAAIRAATNWALQTVRAPERFAVVGGFHSPLEQSVLRLLLEAGSPAVVVLARSVGEAKLSAAWRRALQDGKMAVVSQSACAQRLTELAAQDRNDVAARLADRIFIAHASPGGTLAHQTLQWLGEGLTVQQLGEPV